jgi:hypothetical protein
MKAFLQNALWWVLAVAVAAAVGLGIEWWRRRDLRKFAQEVGGTFEAGGILASVDIPEAAAFPGGSHNNATRVSTPEAGFVVATHYRTWSDLHGRQKSSSYVVCYITTPGREWPAVRVASAVPALIERPGPSPLPVPGATPEFARDFEVRPLEGATPPVPEALARLLPPEVQRELLSNPTLIGGLEARGATVRLQAVGQLAGYPHRDVYAVARRIAALLTK